MRVADHTDSLEKMLNGHSTKEFHTGGVAAGDTRHTRSASMSISIQPWHGPLKMSV